MNALDAIAAVDEILFLARGWVRKTSDAFDDEIRQTLAAGVLDLRSAGVARTDAHDPLIQQALKLYLKANFGYDQQAEKWSAAYEHLKASLAMSGDYRGGVKVDT